MVNNVSHVRLGTTKPGFDSLPGQSFLRLILTFFSIWFLVLAQRLIFSVGRNVFCVRESFLDANSPLEFSDFFYYFCRDFKLMQKNSFCTVFEIELPFRPLDINFATFAHLFAFSIPCENFSGQSFYKIKYERKAFNFFCDFCQKTKKYCNIIS